MKEATELMVGYADRTGITTGSHLERYLWTDAFAVCNFLELRRVTGSDAYTDLALRLVDQVHDVLGRERTSDTSAIRGRWLSGLSESEGAGSPTRGGLRIGKSLAPHAAKEPYDPDTEWDRDGQYFHYLTKWMHALDQLARATGDARFNRWARELAEVAYAAFLHVPDRGPPGLYWKMDTALSRPTVASMGQHDAIDGLVTYVQLQVTAAHFPDAFEEGPSLLDEVEGLAEMTREGDFGTDDPLGIGDLLVDACRMEQLQATETFRDTLVPRLLEDTLDGLRRFCSSGTLHRPPHLRLPFRELGMALGAGAIELIRDDLRSRDRDEQRADDVRARVLLLEPYMSMGASLVAYWVDASRRTTTHWLAQRNINDVMLASALLPDGVAVLRPRDYSSSTRSMESTPSG